jgi:hypothetical protein
MEAFMGPIGAKCFRVRQSKGDQPARTSRFRCALAVAILTLAAGALLPAYAEAQERPNAMTIASWSFSSAPEMAEFWARAQADVVAFWELENPEAAVKVFPRARYDVHTTSAPFKARTGFAIRNTIAYTRHDDVARLGLTPGQAPSLVPAADITVHLSGVSIRMLAVHLHSGCTDRRVYLQGETCDLLRKQAIAVAGWIATRTGTRTPFIVLGDFGRVLSDDDEVWRLISLGESANLVRVPGGANSVCRYGQFEWRTDYIVLGSLAREWVSQAGGNKSVRHAGTMCPHLLALSLNSPASAGALNGQAPK